MIRNAAAIRFLSLVGLCLIGGSAAIADQAEPLPWLRTEGTRIVDEHGQVVKLRGFNIEGWLMWQGPIWGLHWISETRITDQLTELTSTEDVERFRREVHERFIVEEDFVRMKELGANVVRIPFHYRILEDDAEPFTYEAEGWEKLDRAVEWCEKHGLYAILDPHALPGGQSGHFVSDPEKCTGLWGRAGLWRNEVYQDRAVALWKAIATRYADRSVIAGYDLMAAPGPEGRKDAILALYRRMIEAIREVDPRHIVHPPRARGHDRVRVLPRGRSTPTRCTSPISTPGSWVAPGARSTGRSASWTGGRRSRRPTALPCGLGEWGENFHPRIEGTLAHLEAPDSGLSGWGYWNWKRAPRSSRPPTRSRCPSPGPASPTGSPGPGSRRVPPGRRRSRP